MRFLASKLLKDEQSVVSLVESKGFMTYANLYSFKVGGDVMMTSWYVADGWPVRLWASLKLRTRVSLLSFFRMRKYWIEVAKTKRSLLIGHSQTELEALERWFLNNGFENLVALSDGFRELTELENLILKSDLKSIDIIFLALSQPKQEQLMARLSHLEGSVSIVACGAFWAQEAGLSPAPTSLLSNLGVYGAFRFRHSPKVFFDRTFASVSSLIRNFI